MEMDDPTLEGNFQSSTFPIDVKATMSYSKCLHLFGINKSVVLLFECIHLFFHVSLSPPDISLLGAILGFFQVHWKVRK